MTETAASRKKEALKYFNLMKLILCFFLVLTLIEFSITMWLECRYRFYGLESQYDSIIYITAMFGMIHSVISAHTYLDHFSWRKAYMLGLVENDFKQFLWIEKYRLKVEARWFRGTYIKTNILVTIWGLLHVFFSSSNYWFLIGVGLVIEGLLPLPLDFYAKGQWEEYYNYIYSHEDKQA